jgi:zinc carboxypeptidase
VKRRLAVLLAALLSGAASAQAAVPSPGDFLGFEVGADRTLADWTQIAAYFHALDAGSPRVLVREVGKTTEGRPFLLVAITSEANMARLEDIRSASLRLADPRGLSEADAERLIATGRVVVAMSYGIHSTEVGATQASMLTAFHLATAEDEETRAIREQAVVLMLPSHNPDGTQTVTEWYRGSVGTAWEGAAPPFLYQRYTGHDNNRDWYMFTQQESRLTVAHLHDAWRPQVVHDVHEMGGRGARMFVPPYLDPWEPNVDPALVAAVNDLGTHVASRLTTEGRPGVAVHAIYDAWTPARAYPHTHGAVRLLSETATARMASPVTVKASDLLAGIGYDARRRSWNFPAPWPGGAWTLADVVGYQVAASLAVASHAARHREHWLRTSYGVNLRAIRRESPFAYVFPARQKDPLAAAALLTALRTGAVELHRARAGFSAGGHAFDAGAHVVLLRQPYGAFAKQLLERQRYPDVRPFAGAPPQRPYDVTAHTLPLLMGVEAIEIAAPFAADLERVDAVTPMGGRVERGRGPYLALGHATGDLVALGRLLRAGVAVRWATAPFTDRRRTFPRGTLLAPAAARARLAALAPELGLVVRPVSRLPPSLALRAPRVGVYQSWLAPMDEGWTRYVLDRQVPVEYRTLHDADIRAGKLREGLDAIVLPDQSAAQIVAGHAAGTMPPEYVGGIGREGVAALRAFVEEGGTLVALDSATELPISEFALPVSDALAPADAGGAFYIPGSILGVEVDAEPPLAHGLDATAAVWFENSPAFDVRAGRIVARYPAADPLLSGWALGAERLHGRAALVEAPLGRGRVVLFGFRPQYRAQSWSMYVPLLNALYLSAATPAP